MAKSVISPTVGFFGALILMAIANASDNGARLTFYIGDVSSRQVSSETWSVAKLNQEMIEGSEVNTGDESRAELTLLEKSVIRVGENTHYIFTSYSVADSSNNVEASLSKGRLWANIQKMTGKENKFSAKTATAVAAVRGTVFRMDALPDSITEIFVYKGSVEVGGPQWAPDYGKPRKWSAPKQVEGPKEVPLEEWTEIVRAQQKLIIGPKGVISKNKFNLSADKKDDWVAFNLKRDAILNDSKSGQK